MHKCKKDGQGGYRHVSSKCNGEIAIGGYGKARFPQGFGFVEGLFVVDVVSVKYYTGFCFECGESGEFADVDTVKAKRKPAKAINEKIMASQIVKQIASPN